MAHRTVRIDGPIHPQTGIYQIVCSSGYGKWRSQEGTLAECENAFRMLNRKLQSIATIVYLREKEIKK